MELSCVLVTPKGMKVVGHSEGRRRAREHKNSHVAFVGLPSECQEYIRKLRKNDLNAFTDYPVAQLGDKPVKPAPIRRVSIFSYDGDKYCKVCFVDSNIYMEIKAGYLYKKVELEADNTGFKIVPEAYTHQELCPLVKRLLVK